MRTIASWVLAGLLALPIPAMAQVNSLPSQPHLLVKGEAHRQVTPDRFSITVVLRSVAVEPEQARARVQASAAGVLAAFRRNHALPGSVEASSLSMQPSYRYEQPRGQVFEGTEVKRGLSAGFADLADVRQVLASLKTSEEVQLSGIRTSYSKEAEVRAALKRKAAEQTRDSASELAKAYGVRLGGLYTISDVAPSFTYGVQAGTWPAPPSAGGLAPAPPAPAADAAAVVESLEAGSITLSENVYAVFLIAQ